MPRLLRLLLLVLLGRKHLTADPAHRARFGRLRAFMNVAAYIAPKTPGSAHDPLSSVKVPSGLCPGCETSQTSVVGGVDLELVLFDEAGRALAGRLWTFVNVAAGADYP